MTSIIEATLLQRISDLERFIGWVENKRTSVIYGMEVGDKDKAGLLSHLRRELATERGNLRRLRWEQDGYMYPTGPSEARVTEGAETGSGIR